MISSTWSQIAQADKHTQLINSPMAAFSKTSSPNTNKSNSSEPNTISVSFYKNQISFTSPSLAASSDSSSSLDTNKLKDKIESLPVFSSKNQIDSNASDQNESDDFLVTKLKETLTPISDDATLNIVNNQTSSEPSLFNSDDPSIQYY